MRCMRTRHGHSALLPMAQVGVDLVLEEGGLLPVHDPAMQAGSAGTVAPCKACHPAGNSQRTHRWNFPLCRCLSGRQSAR